MYCERHSWIVLCCKPVTYIDDYCNYRDLMVMSVVCHAMEYSWTIYVCQRRKIFMLLLSIKVKKMNI